MCSSAPASWIACTDGEGLADGAGDALGRLAAHLTVVLDVGV